MLITIIVCDATSCVMPPLGGGSSGALEILVPCGGWNVACLFSSFLLFRTR